MNNEIVQSILSTYYIHGPMDLFTGAKFTYSCVAFRYLTWKFKRLAILCGV